MCSGEPVPRIEPRVLHLLGKHSATIPPSPFFNLILRQSLTNFSQADLELTWDYKHETPHPAPSLFIGQTQPSFAVASTEMRRRSLLTYNALRCSH
jgi:hypothetical protein